MPDLDAVYEELTRRLSAHESDFRATDNTTVANTAGPARTRTRGSRAPTSCSAPPTETYPDGQLFAGVRKGMQGKSCINFTRDAERDLLR